MNMIKSTTLALTVLSAALTANASVTFLGTAFLNVPNVSVGDVSFFIIDETGSGFGSISLSESQAFPTFTLSGSTFTLTSGSDFFGSNFTPVGTRTAGALGSNVSLSGAYSGVNLGNGVDSGDRFAIVVFATSTSSTVANDTYRIFTDPTWVVPADSNSGSYVASPTGGNFRQLGAASTPAFVKTVTANTVIPEPSTFAALAGVAVLGLASLRRRRA